jgi:NAD(P)-dependent dehydrogenase (short-subunit alcohol dehydrogenase family)
MDAEQQVVVVTGSSSGIGAACAAAFARQGAAVVVNSRSSVEAGEAVARELGGSYVQADVATVAGAESLVAAALASHGRIDVLVNNAGTTVKIPHADLDAASPEVWMHLYETNVVGPFVTTRAALPALRASGGCVINVSSLAGVRPLGSSIPYAASKAALNHQTRLLAAVLGPQVRVNAVAPGLVDTPWTADWADERAAITAVSPLHRVASPEDVAQMVVALAGAAYTTGEVVLVDGGMFLR